MKKLLCCLLALLLAVGFTLPALAAQTTAQPYDRVFIIGVDGAGRFIRDVDTPNFDRIFADGAVDYTARAEIITTSAQNWGAILTGVSYSTHGLDNGTLAGVERASDTAYPTVFTYARRAFPNAVLASFVNWEPINHGLIENDINVNKQNPGDDEAVTTAICDYFDGGNRPTLFFVQLDEVDHAGHTSGSRSDEYIEAIKAFDSRLGRIYDAADRNGLLENALFIVVADHGHTGSGGHGGLTMRETNVTLAVSGKGVVKGSSLDKIARNRDVAAIALYALGIERPAYMTARIPANLFEGVEGETRPIRNDWRDGILSRLSWILTLITKPF